MRKTMTRLLTAVMMVMLLCSLTIMSVSAANEGPTCDGNHVGWTAITEGGTLAPEADTNYYLDADLTSGIHIKTAAGINVKLCMCGHKIETASKAFQFEGANIDLINCQDTVGQLTVTGQYAILAGTSSIKGTLNIGSGIALSGADRTFAAQNNTVTNIYDGVTITGNGALDGGAMYLWTATVNMYGGTVTGTISNGGTAALRGGAVYISSGTKFNMYGGTITGQALDSTDDAKANGGGVYMNNANGKFTMYGGTITGCKAYNGGAVYVNSGTFTLAGGTIDASNSVIKANGAAFYVASAGKLLMTGGEIGACKDNALYILSHQNNPTEFSGGVVNASVGVYTGSADRLTKISGGTFNKSVTSYGVMQISGGTFNSSVVASGSTAGSDITITDGAFGGEVKKSKDSIANTFKISGGRFANDPSAFVVDGKIAVADTSVEPYKFRVADPSELVPGECPNHENWTAITKGGSLAASGHYYLTKDLTDGITVPSGVEATICLNGHSIVTGGTVFTVGTYQVGPGTLTVCNCVAASNENPNSGKLTRTTNTNRAVNMYGASELNINDNVHFVGSTAEYLMFMQSGSVVNMYGGSIVDNKSVSYGVNIPAGATFNLYDGTISGNVASADYEAETVSYKNGGTFRVDGGTLNIMGGTITGSSNNFIYGVGSSTTTISGGTINGAGNSIGTYGGNAKLVIEEGAAINTHVATYGTTTMTGGTVNGNVSANKGESTTGKVYIQGGAVTGKLTSGEGCTYEISGGRFVNDPSAFVVEGKAAIADTSVEPYQFRVDVPAAPVEPGECPDHENWTEISGGFVIDKPGHYCLTADIAKDQIKVTAKNVVLCMNGHTLANEGIALRVQGGEVEVINCQTTGGTITGTVKYSAIQVDADSVLTINTGVSVTGCTVGNAVLIAGGTVNLKGGSIKDNDVRGVYLYGENSVFNMESGVISGNASDAGAGVNVEGEGSVVNMTGGTISGNTAKNGGGVYVTKGTFNMSGNASITGNACTVETQWTSGGGAVYVAANGTFNMSGNATITENTAVAHGAGVFTYGKLNLSENAAITGNTSEMTNGSGVFVRGADAKVTMTGGTISGAGNMFYMINGAATAEISGGTLVGSIYTNNDTNILNLSGTVCVNGTIGGKGVITITGGRYLDDPSANVASGYKAFADTSVEPYQFRVDVAPDVGECPDHENWTEIGAGANLAITEAGHYVLTEDATRYVNFNIGAGNEATLCLNGHTLSSSGIVLNVTSGHLKLINCGETAGVIEGKAENTDGQSAVQINSGATVTMYEGVEITGTMREGVGIFGDAHFIMEGGAIKNSTVAYGAVRAYGGNFTMNGGEISGNTSANSGAGVLVSANRTFTMNGGTISGNTSSASGAGVHVSGIFIMNNGTISGNTSTAAQNWSNGGAGVFVKGGAEFTMNGGTISGNTATGNGGGVSVFGTFTMNNGEISGNTGHTAGNAVYVRDAASKMVMTGGTIEGAANAVYLIHSTEGAIISGGLLSCGNDSDSAVYTNDADGRDPVVISGNTFVKGQIAGKGPIAISGGKFSAAPKAEKLATDKGILSVLKNTGADAADFPYIVGAGFNNAGEYIGHESSIVFGLYLNADAGFESLVFNAGDYTVAAEINGRTLPATITSVTGNLLVSANGIVAKEMHDKITFTVKKGDAVWFADTLSVYDAAVAWTSDANAEDDTMLADMINYGIEAQKAFNYKKDQVDALTVSGTADVPSWTRGAGHGVSDGFSDMLAVTLSLKDKIELNFYVKEANVTATTGKVTQVESTDGETITRITFDDIAVKDAKNAVEFTITTSRGDCDVKYSIADYAVQVLAKNQDQVELIQALMKYVDSVADFLN